jgi:hypothetical protein
VASVAEIERLAALVERLLPLAAKGHGEVIAAQDWNTVVGAVLEVARAVVGQGAGDDVAPHDHPDQVTLGWLEPSVRALIERGPLDDPVAVRRIGAVERGVASTQERLDALAAELRTVRAATGRVEVADLGREATLTRLSRKVDGLGDAREDVTAVRRTLDVLRTDVTSVASFAEGFRGVEPAAVVQGLRQVEDLRTRLTTPTGALLDAAEVERRLTELRTTLVTEEELTEALGGVRVTLPDDLRTTLVEQSRAAAREQAEASTGALSERLAGQIANRLAEVEAVATRAATNAAEQIRTGLRAELADSLRGELGAQVTEGDNRLRAELRDAVARTEASLGGLVDQRVGALQGSLETTVTESLRRLQPEITASVTESLAGSLRDLSSRIGTMETRVGELRQSVTANATEVAALRQTLSAEIDRSTRELRASVDAQLRDTLNRVTTSQNELRDTLRGEIAVERQRVDRVVRVVPIDGGGGGPIRPIIVNPLRPIE